MKIVREHINEIRQDKESGLGAIGIGKNAVMIKLKEFINEFTYYSSLAHHDAHGNRIANILGLTIENVRQYGIDSNHIDITEVILYFDHSISSFSKYNKDYWVWKNPNFIIEYSAKTEKIMLYTNKNLNEENNIFD
jgi:hypothetical protein